MQCIVFIYSKMKIYPQLDLILWGIYLKQFFFFLSPDENNLDTEAMCYHELIFLQKNFHWGSNTLLKFQPTIMSKYLSNSVISIYNDLLSLASFPNKWGKSFSTNYKCIYIFLFNMVVLSMHIISEKDYVSWNHSISYGTTVTKVKV